MARRKWDPDGISNQVLGRFPLKLVRLCLRELYGFIADPVSIFTPGSGSPGSGSGPGAELATRQYFTWVANGPYRVDDEVDGARVVQTACEVRNVRLWRGVPGTSGTTVLDVKRRPAGSAPGDEQTLYLTEGNRPSIAYSDADYEVTCALPDSIALAANDIIIVDTVTKESGRPYNWTLTLEAA